MRRSLLVASTLVAVAGSARAQAVLLRVGGQPGQSQRYQTVMEMWMRGGPMAMMGGDTTQPFMRRTAFVTRTVTAVSGDTITATESNDSAHVETPGNPGMAAMMQGASGQGIITTTKMNDRGVIYSASASGGVLGAGGANGMGGGGMGQGGGMGGGGRGGRGGRGMMGGMGRNQGTMFALPENAVRPGDTWTDTMVVNGGTPDEPTTTLIATYKLDRVDQGHIAVVSMNGNMSMSGGANPGMMAMAINGQFQLDVSAKRLVGMNMGMNGSMQSPQGEIPMKMQMTQTPLP